MRRAMVRLVMLLSLILAAAVVRPAEARSPGEGADLAIGGPGEGPGQFLDLRDIALDAQNRLYVLDGGEVKKEGRKGNFRVQKFDDRGKFLAEFSVWKEELGAKNRPTRLAVDRRGNVYVTQPEADLVQQFGPDGKWQRDVEIPCAWAVTPWSVAGNERIAVIGSRRAPGAKAWLGGDRVFVIDPAGAPAAPVPLSPGVSQCQDAATDAQGNLYLLAAVNQLYKYDPSGKRLMVIGAGENTRAEDGSELLHSVAVDSRGNVYSMTPGNPGWVTRFDPAMTNVTQRKGQFQWADPWSVHSSYTPLAIDAQDRLWVAATGLHNPKGPNFAKYHPRPAVVRTVENFLDPAQSSVTQTTTLLLGLKAVLETELPYQTAYDLRPVPVAMIVKPANRRVREIAVRYHVFDMVKNEVAEGRFELALQDGAEARHAMQFTPPRFGWYEVACEIFHQDRFLTGVGLHVAVTPKYDGMPVLEAGQSPGGWTDALRQMFVGLPNMRLHAVPDLAKLDRELQGVERWGAFAFVQFSDRKDCTPERVREAVTRFRGRVKYWEIMNEPNFFMKPEEYVELVRQLAPLIKRIDPEAKVLGPAVCGVQLPWYEAFYKAGGGPYCDILSIHDYEGHESIDPVHWFWKIGELRKLMAAHGDAQKPVWQTERAITGVRARCFLGGAQAVRVTLHRDLLERLGIPNEHNNHYYLNQAGYSSVPSYLWSSTGPHPGALALRTRYAMTRGLRYAGDLDFGPTGNKIFWGLRYEGAPRQTIILRNLGTLDQTLRLGVRPAAPVEVTDSFGNTRTVAADGGQLTLVVPQMPIYLRPARGQEIVPPRIDFGDNLAAEAAFSYSAEFKGEPAWLNNGIMEVIHAGNPHGGTSGDAIFTGSLPSLPQTLEIALPRPRTVGRMLVFGLRADNTFCALLDYDLEYRKGDAWVTIEKVRTPCPASDLLVTSGARADTWLLDNHFFVHRFEPVTTDRLRLVVRRTTFGVVPDDVFLGTGKPAPGRLNLREIEIYGP